MSSTSSQVLADSLMTEARKTARRIFREWCAANGIVIYPMAGADLMARIEAALQALSPADGGAKP